MKEKLWARLTRLIPRYLWGPLIACLTVNLLAYYIPRAVNIWRLPRYYDLSLPLDKSIPLVPAFILVYVAAFASWYVGYALICREGPEKCGVIFGDLIAKAICMVFFILLPTTLDRPEPTGSGPVMWLLRLIYAADTPPDNLFPSIHCLESWMVWRGMTRCTHLSRGLKIGYFVMALLVFAATLLVKQHVIVDLPAAVAVGEIGLLLSDKLRLGERFARWCHRREVTA